MSLKIDTIVVGGVEAKQMPWVRSSGNLMNIRDKIERIATWCDGEAQLGETLLVATPEGPKIAQPGDWVVRETDGRFCVYSDEEFTK